jgi:hypothetical protein
MLPALVVSPAPPGEAVDVDVPLTELLLDALANRGKLGIIRYVPLPGVNPTADISPVELERILSHPACFWSAFVQHPRFPGWRPREHDPEADARLAAAHARAAGYPAGCTGYVDAEGMHEDTTWQEAHAYNSAWARVLVAAGFRAGLYDGYSEPETPTELYAIHDVTTYWTDLANRQIATRGTAIIQGAEFDLLDVRFDADFVRPDRLGETPYVARRA